MDDAIRLALEANGETVVLRKGQTVHFNGIPYELLENVPAYSATKVDSPEDLDGLSK